MRKDTNVTLVRLVNKMFEKGFTSPQKIADNIDAFNMGMISFMSFNYAVCTKFLVQYGLYCKTIKNLGTERHNACLLDGCSLKTFGCFCMTELGHGSNVRGVEVTAEYDKTTKEFILNSPTDTSMKFWIGNLAKTCQNAVVFAQLIIEEGGKKVNKGVHVFLWEIRDRATHNPHPGIEIGDWGHKKGLNGIDNGWVLFKKFRIPREGLLNRFGDVSEDGVYTTPIENDGKRFANSIASLSGGRVAICRMAPELSLFSLTIALRYAGVRRQFGPSGNESLLLDYPLHLYRLVPRFAEHFVNLVGANRLVKMWGENLPKLLEEGNVKTEVCHALSSNLKAFVSWNSQETIAEWRKACGGNGYSHYALFAETLNFNDLHQTWEGDCHVLLFQSQRFLLKALSLAAKKKPLPETTEFLSLGVHSVPKFEGSIECVHAISKLFAQRASYYAIKAAMALNADPKRTEEAFQELQPFELRDMCEAYHDTYVIDTFLSFLSTFTWDKTKAVFAKLLALHMHNTMLQGGSFFRKALGDEVFGKLKTLINHNLKELRKEIISITDVLPFSNRGYGPLGNADMQVYERFIQHFKAAPKVTERPEYWKLSYINSEQK